MRRIRKVKTIDAPTLSDPDRTLEVVVEEDFDGKPCLVCGEAGCTGDKDIDEHHRVKCGRCGFRPGVSCVCGMSFKERMDTVGVDMEALRILHGR